MVRPWRPRMYCALVVLMSSSSAWSQEPAPAVPAIEAMRIEGPIKVDGLLDEWEWQQPEVATGFVQREPDEFTAASEVTEIRVIYTPTTLYVGVRCFDDSPEEIVAAEMGRDVPLFRDDSIVLLLDTFHDHRNAYFFETNPTASRTDGLVTDEGRDFNIDWDGVWSVASTIDAEGWTAEIAIPFRTLRYDASLTTWGLNIRRGIRRKNETVFWAPIGLDSDLFRVSKAGHLNGISGIASSVNLNVKPYLRGSVEDTPETGTVEDGEPGIDVKWGVTRGLSLDLTVNTDFAETEVDEQRLNLTRFSLFFPEKREFFLENAGIFEFGSPGDRGGPLFRLFFSRRIGLSPDEGEEVPMDWGIRLAGKQGEWSIGLLDAQTDILETPLEQVPENNWSVVRLKRNIGARSTVGIEATQRYASGDDHNQTIGVDFDLRPTNRWWVFGYAAASDDPGPDDDAHILSMGAEWTSAFWQFEGQIADNGENFNPEAGFLRREGVTRYKSEVRYRPRPEQSRIRNYDFSGEVDLYVRPDGSTESLDTQADFFGFELRSGDFVSLFSQYKEEGLLESFEIVDGVVIPEGEYSFLDGGLFYRTSQARPVFLRGALVAGEFYDGDRRASRLTAVFRPSRYLRGEAAWNWTDVKLPSGDFTTNIMRFRLSASFSPDMGLDGLFQYNDEEELLSFNVRYNWMYRPGSDLFVVLNQAWDAPHGISGLDRRDTQLIVKFTYLWQR